jgi:type II secretory ATPase GspE/PulE/Tfp pilus assembly ATPase PilB-like protein
MFDYVNVIYWLIAFASLLAWARFATFVSADVSQNLVEEPEVPWRLGMIGGLLVMLLMYILMPNFWLALVANLVIAGGLIGFYQTKRVKALGPSGSLFSGTMKTLKSGREKAKEAAAAAQVQLTYLHKDDSPVQLPGVEDPLSAGLAVADRVMIDALVRRADIVELAPAPGQQGYVLSYVVDGVPYNQPALDRPSAEAALQAFKVLGGLAAEERRRPQSGRFKTKDATGALTIWTVQTSGSTAGERLTLIANEKAQWDLRLDGLGFSSDQLKDIKAIVADTKGVVLVSSPKGQGRTSTLYGLLRQHDAFMNAVATLETNPQAEIEGAAVNRFDGRGEVTFSKALSSIFLKDPNIVLVSQLPDAATADAITRFTTDENAGPRRAYIGLGSSDTLGAMELWMSLNTDKEAAADALRLIICQRLIRILCPTCKIPYQPDEGTLKKLNLPVGRNLQSFKANTAPIVDKKGNSIICPDCAGLGFRGRTGIFEVMVVTDEMKKAIKANANQNQIKSIARKNNMILLVEHGIRKFASGVTAINEVTRVLGADKPASAKGEAAAR